MTNSIFQRKLKTGSLFFYLLFFFSLISFQSSAQDLLKLIPATATGVFTMDGGSFFRKIDLDQINRLEMFQDMDEKTKGKKGSKYDEYSKIYKDPSSLGLNVLSKAYIYFENSTDTSRWGTPYIYTGMLFALSKSKKFENFLKKVIDEGTEITKEGNYKFCKTGYSSLIAWNSHQLIILVHSGYGDESDMLVRKELKKLINQTNEECIKTNKSFMAAQSEKFDFNYWMNFQSLTDRTSSAKYMYMPLYKEIPFIGADFYKEYYLQVNLNFNKGNISMDAKQTLSEKSASKIKDVYGRGLNPDFMKYLHKDHLLGIYSYSLNMKGVKAILDTALTDSIKNGLNEGFIKILYEDKIKNDPQIKKMQADVDSMYSDLYPSSNYSKNYDDNDYTTSDTAVSYDSYDYDSTYAEEEPAVIDTSSISEEEFSEDNSLEKQDNSDDEMTDDDSEKGNSNEEKYTGEIYSEEDYAVDSVAVEDYTYDTTSTYDYSADTTYTDYDYTYKKSKEDSLYDAKYEKINAKRDEIDDRKKELFQQKVKDLNLSKDFLFDLFAGDAMGAITDYYFIEKKYKSYDYDDVELKTIEVEKTKKEPYPEFLVGFTINNLTEANKLINALVKDSFLLKQDNYYVIPVEKEQYKFYATIAGNLLIITNDLDVLKKNFNGYPEEERLSKELQEVLLNKTSSFYVNFKDIFARLPYDNMSPERRATYTILMNSFRSLSFTSDHYKNNVSHSAMSFDFTNKIDNSFYEIFRIINEIYKINRKNW